ncbi:MAG: CRISPR-associated helicase Cas3' [Candidatus Cloacimonadaceae bacterium]|jgi:CRISPR-associated endonuclease/helicase Cas3|nr:CRISPR-associated helicase Cas3' [Candidatus Cloacimonadota bacterium]MCK9243100.1 CRISPR-associated helicase Cas3' [Candidatus Cloacimonadota bacterium]MDY0126893.1 CRISPR-associated helicase Cas3' [Candidatus Cloacimonadaceae bacterium]
MIISHPAYKEYQRKPLTVHLTSVAQGCKARIQRLSLDTRLISGDSLANLAFRIGLLHDLGKASSYFQTYVQGGVRSAYSKHSLISAIILYHNLKDDGKWDDFAAIGFKAAQRHHGNLSSFGSEGLDQGILIANTLKTYEDICLQISRDNKLQDFIALHNITLPKLNKRYLEELSYTLEDFEPIDNPDDAIERFFIQNLLFSVLIDADKYDAARIDIEPDRSLDQDLSFSPERLIATFDKADNDLNRIRGELLKASCNVNIGSTKSFAMSAPTGSGKTLSCLGFAETLQKSLPHRRRVIYCLPYTSIIDQNYEVVEKVLLSNGFDACNPDILLKHHHLVDFTRHDKDDEYDYRDFMNDNLVADSWNAACVVSTFVQLFHSLIGTRNSMVRKLHNIINSIILLDEVQSLPPKYYPLLRRIFSVLAERFHTHILTCTATQPFIFEPNTYLEISPQKLFDHPVFNRVKLHIHKSPIDLDTFVQNLELSKADNALFVMNTKRCAIDLFNMLNAEYGERYTVFCLTTLHTPSCRLGRIEDVRKALQAQERIILVSTQLIEAGVDLSFSRVYRDLGPLDSVIQVAGRCNRHGELGVLGGEMHLIYLVNESREYSQLVYDRYILSKTREILYRYETLESRDFSDLIREYYQSLEFTAEANAIMKAIAELNYDQEIRGQLAIERFRLIEDQYASISVYLLLTPKAQSDMDSLLEAREILKDKKNLDEKTESKARLRIANAYNSLARFQINLNPSEFKNYSIQTSYIHKLDEHIYYILHDDVEKAYSSKTGFLTEPKEMGSALSL